MTKQPPKDRESDLQNDAEITGDDEAVKRGIYYSLLVVASLLVVGGVGYLIYRLNNRPDEVAEKIKETKKAETRATSSAIPKVLFKDITNESGIDFFHTNGSNGKNRSKLLPQTMGGGVAFLDYDNDGDQDLFFVNSCYWPDQKPEDQPDPTMQLYSNDGKGSFENVTKKCGLDVGFYGMGVAVGDFDGDGWRDLFVTAVGKNHLFRNQNGTFVEVTDNAGVGGRPQDWGTSCGFFDFNNDGPTRLVCLQLRCLDC